VCLTRVRAWNPFEHRSAESRLFLRAASRYYQKTKSTMTIPPRLKFTNKPAILKTKTKTKMIQPYQRARLIEAETTYCQRSPKTTKRRCLNRTGCYLNSYSNNKPNGRRREPECSPNSTAAEPSTDRRIPEISPRSLRWLIPYGTAAERKSWISSSKHYDQTLHPTSIYSQEAIPIKSSMQSLFSTPGITTQIRLSDRRKIRTDPNGLVTYERPRTHV